MKPVTASPRAQELLLKIERRVLDAGFPPANIKNIHRQPEIGVDYWIERHVLELGWDIRSYEGVLVVALELTHLGRPTETLFVHWDADSEGYAVRAGADEAGGLDFQFPYFQRLQEVEQGWIGQSRDEAEILRWIDALIKAFADYSP
jgi:hypothetical protein